MSDRGPNIPGVWFIEGFTMWDFFRFHRETGIGDVDFECWCLRRDIYEEAARMARLEGGGEI